MVSHCKRPRTDLPAVIEVGHLELSRTGDHILALIKCLDRRIVHIGLVLEDTGYGVAPDFSELHSHIILRRGATVTDVAAHRPERARIIDIFQDRGLAVPDHSLYTVAERLATESELVPP